MKYHIDIYKHDELLEATPLPFSDELLSVDLLGRDGTLDRSVSTVLNMKYGEEGWTHFHIVHDHRPH
jgi:hypothetical protein